MSKAACVGLVLASAVSVAAAAPLVVQVPAEMDADAPIAKAARAECGIPMKMGSFALEHVRRRNPDVIDAAQLAAPPQPLFLKLRILGALGAGGGAWSGGKSIMLRADLLKDGQVVRSKIFNRSSRGGFWGGMSGTCAIMDRVMQALGKDTAAWVGVAMASDLSVPQPLVVDPPSEASAESN